MILKGKVVLITGASRGIGRSIAETCGKNGADVIVNYNNNEEEAMKVVKKIREYGVKAIAIKSDVKNIKEVSSMFKKINLEFKKLDILINNAGILKDNLLLLCKPEDYDEIMDVNLKGQFLCMQHAAKMMIKQKNVV